MVDGYIDETTQQFWTMQVLGLCCFVLGLCWLTRVDQFLGSFRLPYALKEKHRKRLGFLFLCLGMGIMALFWWGNVPPRKLAQIAKAGYLLEHSHVREGKLFLEKGTRSVVLSGEDIREIVRMLRNSERFWVSHPVVEGKALLELTTEDGDKISYVILHTRKQGTILKLKRVPGFSDRESAAVAFFRSDDLGAAVQALSHSADSSGDPK